MQEVKSSMFTHVGHEPATNTLRVRFANGGEYDYSDVTAEEHKALMEAESIGKHFGTHIRNKKTATKVEAQVPQGIAS